MATGAALSNYLENAVLNHFLKAGASIPQPTAVYVGLFTDPINLTEDQPSLELSGGGYARVLATYSPATTGTTSNLGDLVFPKALADWGTINYGGIFDAAVGGNMLIWGPLTQPKTVEAGDTFKLPIGAFTVTLD